MVTLSLCYPVKLQKKLRMLQGPLIAATFSTVIKDKKLMKFGVINGLVGLFLATLVGFVFGLIVGSVDERYGVGDGLGQEILSR